MDWPEYFAQRRIMPRLKAATDSGNLPLQLVPKIEGILSHLSQLCGPKIEPSLLHGDAHSNNFLSTDKGLVMIDPSVYFGHPEIDLASVNLFTPVPEDLIQGYQEVAAIDSGFSQRRNLWLIPAYLAMVQLEGPRHLDKLMAAIKIYL